jgi:ATP-dependent helicase/DNAse subunit B
MIKRAETNPEIFLEKTIKIKEDLPWFWLDEGEEIILCGKIDWIKYVEETDSVEIIDFKTGKNKEDEGSLQLPIYLLLMKNCQKRKTTGAYYWYLQTDEKLTPKELPDEKEAYEQILKIAKEIKKARAEGNFECTNKNCRNCKQFEKILNGEAKFVGVGPYNQDLYLVE